MSGTRMALPAFAYEIYPGDILDGEIVTTVSSTGRGAQDTTTITRTGRPDVQLSARHVCEIKRRLVDVVAAAPATSDPEVVRQIVDLVRADT